MKEAHPSRPPIRFGVYELNIDCRELRKQGLRVKLQDQPFQILRILLEQPGKVVTREELQQKIWPSDTFVDFDHGVYNAVQKLRDALDDSAESPRFIETLSRRGYRFIAPVNSPERSPSAVTGATRESIVVLPFINMSPDAENEFFADGITEEIINSLAQIKQLHVIARSSAFSFKGKHIDPRVIGEQLNVRTVLEGSVRRAENRLRITVQLVDAADGFHLWSERFDREMKDVFDIQDEIARSVAARLKVTLEADQQQLVRAGTDSVEAYQQYLKGRTLLYRRGSAILRSQECFRHAVTVDPKYALAWAGLADCYTTLGYYGLARPETCMPKGMDAARRAVALDSSLAEVHNSLAMASLMGSWNKTEAEHEFVRALELNPRYIQALDWYALFYLQLATGRMEEGIAQAKLAVESDPLSAYTHTILGLTYFCIGKYAEAERIFRRAVQLDSESFLARACLVPALHLTGHFEEAIAVGESALAISGRHPWAVAFMATTLADWGRPSDTGALYAELVARARRSYVQYSSLATVAAAAGLDDEAIRHARDAFEDRDPMAPIFFSSRWPPSGRIRACPRFCSAFAGLIWE